MIASTATSLTFTREHTSARLFVPSFIGAYFGLRVCITFLFFQSSPQTGAGVSVALNLVLLVLTAIYSFGPGTITIGSIFKTPTVRLVFAYLALTFISLTWSETSSKAVALTYWSAMTADVLLVLLLVRANHPAAISEALLKGYVYGVVILSLIAWCAPAMQDLRLGDDEFLTPNAIGFECAIATFLCQYFAPRSTRWKWLGGFLALTLLRSLSKTSIIAFLIAETFYLFRTSLIRRATKFRIVFTALLTMACFSPLIAGYYNVYTNAGTQAETLTGRTSIWLSTIGFAIERPWLGHGFHSFRTVVPPFGTFQPWHAHNELIQQFFAYGIVGILLVSLLYFNFYRLCKRNAAHPFALTGLALLLMVLVRGLTDTERFDVSFPLWTFTAASLLLSATPLQTEEHLR